MAQAKPRERGREWRPSATIRTLAVCAATIPFWYNATPYALLNPLFSSAPANATGPRVVAYAVLFAAFLIITLVPAATQYASWRTCWLVIAIWKLVSPPLLELAAEPLLRLGLDHGVIAGRILLGGLDTVATWIWVLNSFTCDERSRLFPPYVLFALYAGSFVSHFEAFSLITLPECYVLHAHAVLLAAVALFAPCPVRHIQARGRRHSRQRFALMYASAATKMAIFAGMLLVAGAASRSSRHCPLSRGDSTGILASRKSITGWISVGEYAMSQAEGTRGDMTMRYLRADHSLIGGLWIGPSRDGLASRHASEYIVDEHTVVRHAESIYSTFILQELIRLVIRPAELPHALLEQGLIIGLGAGLSARALAQHRVNLTIVEVDPVVYEFAVKYFAVDDVVPGEVVLEDAVTWAQRQAQQGQPFDYIVHDVFTGGAVPASLFRLEFLQQLSTLLHPTGVLALNFAGDFSSVSSTIILTTLHRVFPRCRAFGDSETSSTYSNIVILCTKDWYTDLELRDPVKADFLPYPSPAIREQVFSRFRSREIDISSFKRKADSLEGDDWLIRTDSDVRRVEREQLQDIGVHWTVMRDVLPNKVWAQW